MSKKVTIIVSSLLLLIAVGVYFFHFNTGTKQSETSQNTSKQSTSGKLVEIFYLPHPPAEAIVTEVEQVLAQHPDYAVTKYDFSDPESAQKTQTYGVTDHTPIAIFINGMNTFDVGGNSISLVNFPRGDAFVPTLEGTWNYDDLDKILAEDK